MTRNVEYRKLPWTIWLLEKLGICNRKGLSTRYKLFVFSLTFCIYSSYHMSRKPFSVVKVTLCPACANCSMQWNRTVSMTDDVALFEASNLPNNVTPGWPPFNDVVNSKTLLGSVDYSWLFSYAIFLYLSGYFADRLNLRYFLTLGMIGSGISVCLMGVAYFAGIHKLYYFILVQIFGGALQSTGWPGVVAVMSQWFGKHNRGLIMGVWNSHTSVGNILGTIIPSFWADCDGDNNAWGWAFLVPGFIIIFFGIVTFLSLVTDPTHVGLPSPTHHMAEDLRVLEASIKNKKKFTPEVITGTKSNEADSVMISNACSHINSPDSDISDSVSVALIGKIDEESGEDEREAEAMKDRRKWKEKTTAVNFLRALTIPGVVEYALALFFNKLVSYTFLFWLPLYIKYTRSELTGPESDWLSTLFDVGGILGGILAGVVSDRLNARAITCVAMLLLAVPSLLIFRTFGNASLGLYIVLLVVNGVLINGPYSMITTAVSSDLGTHPSLKFSQNAKATVTAIIDGTGSLGAAGGPLVVGLISDHASWTQVFYFLMASCILSSVFLCRLVISEAITLYQRCSCVTWHHEESANEEFELQRLNSLSQEDSAESNREPASSDCEHA